MTYAQCCIRSLEKNKEPYHITTKVLLWSYPMYIWQSVHLSQHSIVSATRRHMSFVSLMHFLLIDEHHCVSIWCSVAAFLWKFVNFYIPKNMQVGRYCQVDCPEVCESFCVCGCGCGPVNWIELYSPSLLLWFPHNPDQYEEVFCV